MVRGPSPTSLPGPLLRLAFGVLIGPHALGMAAILLVAPGVVWLGLGVPFLVPLLLIDEVRSRHAAP